MGISKTYITITPADVWTYTSRTLTAPNPAPSDIWAYNSRTLTSPNPAPSDIWAHEQRILRDEFVASDDVILNNAAYQQTDSTTYVKLKETQINVAGTYKLTFELAVSSNVYMEVAYGRIYKNGYPFGTEHTNGNTTFVTMEDTLTVPANSLIQIYAKQPTYTTAVAQVKNFKVCGRMKSLADYVGEAIS